jgi:excisionase family DNA binding protein
MVQAFGLCFCLLSAEVEKAPWHMPGIGKGQSMKILTANEVACLLRITKTTVYNLAAEGKISGFRVGNSWRFDIDEIIQQVKVATQEGKSKQAVKGPKMRREG